jgi:hypothetical protein
MVASRKTDAFPDLLGPARPAPQPSPGSKTTLIRAALTRQLFEDRLVVSLWTSNFQARRRARALIAAAREARQRVTEVSAALTATQRQLDALCADRDSDAARAEELNDQIASLRDELARAAQERDRVAAELVALRSAPTKTAPPDPRLQMLTDACGAAKREATELGQQLAAAESQLAELRQRCQIAETARAAAEKQAAEHQAALAAAELRASEQASVLAAAERRSSEREVAAAAAERQATDQGTALAAAQGKLAELQAKVDEAQAERELWQRNQSTTEQDRAVSQQELEALRAELAAAETAIEPLRQQAADAEAARAAAADQLETVQRQQQQWLAECRILQANHAEEVASLTDERDELRRQLDELASTPAAAITPHSTPAPAWSVPGDQRLSVEDDGDASSAELDDPKAEAVAWPELSRDHADAGDADAVDHGPQSAPASTNAENDSNWKATDAPWDQGSVDPKGVAPLKAPPAVDEETAPKPVAKHPVAQATTFAASASLAASSASAAEPQSPYSTPSFIDKYRHLLEDEGGEPAPELAKKRPNRLLDDEFLSPTQSTPVSPGDDESDEALEAYMSNMMRRVRGDGPAVAPIPVVDAFGTTPAPEVAPAPEPEPEIELDENGMLRLVRKQPMTTNLSALREIANTSARTAIAHHRQRRRVESAVSKSLVCVTASAASAYLMLTAPDMQSPWFWGGCVSLVAAVGSGAQLAVIYWQRFTDRRRPSHGAASMPYGAGQPSEADFAEPTPTL